MSLREKALAAIALPCGLVARANLRLIGVEFGEGLNLLGFPIVFRSPRTRIRIGRSVTLCSWSRYTALGVNHPVVLRTVTPGAQIEIGDHVGISGGSICAAVAVTIGAYTMLGANVTVVDTDFHALNPENRRYSQDDVKSAAVIIGENVFIGTGSFVLKGVHIGDNSVIGCGSVVTRDIPSDTIAAGNPCKVIRPLRQTTGEGYR